MTGVDLIERVRSRGGDLRVVETRLQYRPAGVLNRDELAWLARHRRQVVEDLVRSEVPRDALPAGPAMGEAGPAVPAWHCYFALGRPHERAVRADGSDYCGTCHPRTVAARRRP